VRSAEIRKLEEPEALLAFWHKTLALYADLGARPLPPRPERFVPDRQISAGWLHSGYPIMGHLVHGPQLTDLRGLSRPPRESEGAWGFWHELGHNHQQDAWTFDGTTEVTCNLFSLFVEESVRGILPWEHPWARNQLPAARKYLERPDFNVWKQEPGVALWAYIDLRREFGWDAFRKAFRTYTEARPGDLPKTDQGKRDEWLRRMSRATGRNLAAQFDRWGIPVSAAARADVAELPSWTPPELPPEKDARK
jgi:hypothetical protein